MQRKLVLAVAIPICAIGISAALALKTPATPPTRGPALSEDPDSVLASFEREFGREPGPQPKAKRDSIDEDVLYRTINTIHWSADIGTDPKNPANEENRDDDVSE